MTARHWTDDAMEHLALADATARGEVRPGEDFAAWSARRRAERAAGSRAATAAAIRSSVERGDPLAIMRTGKGTL